MTTPALLPSASPMSIGKWAIGSIVIVIFALVVLQLLASRGYDPVAYIARMFPAPSAMPPSPVNGTPATANGAAALA